MNAVKKLDRFKQWAGERMGGEAKTSVSDDFRALEEEMTYRHEGMERLQRSMTLYVKSLSKTKEAEDKEKSLPVANLGSTMVTHGEDFENDSEFGSCLISMGRANERIARVQENYVAKSTSSWLESLERSLAQMKEYQAARKKLENRRLAYDASLSKMQKAKKEDFRVEEELRSQKAKYEESSEDVYRRMQDIKEAEGESIADLGAFLEAELEHYDRCRDVLVQLKRDWPGRQDALGGAEDRRSQRSRANTAHAYGDRHEGYDGEQAPTPEPRPSIRSSRVAAAAAYESPARELPGSQTNASARPANGRASTFQGPTQIHRDVSPVGGQHLSRIPTDPPALPKNRSQLRPVGRVATANDVFGDPSDESTRNDSSPDRSYGERSISPATSHGSIPSRTASSTTLNAGFSSAKKAPPPPPPCRSKKPPPPPPMKRSALSTSSVQYS
ncbi:MAG: hypothetical protein M1832_005866 [Thelocarpon impressellum]|nr:MAG: hypothetical protein M1832_005866 [Thelocarpon impressellum]